VSQEETIRTSGLEGWNTTEEIASFGGSKSSYSAAMIVWERIDENGERRRLQGRGEKVWLVVINKNARCRQNQRIKGLRARADFASLNFHKDGDRGWSLSHALWQSI